MAKKISDKERQRIIDLLPTGKSCREIAREVGRSKDTVSRIAREVGHEFGRINAERAREAMKAYGKENRASLINQLHEKAVGMLKHFEGPHLVYSFGGRDNTYSQHVLAEPPVEVKQAAAKTIHILQKSIIETLKYDNPAGSISDSDYSRYLDETFGTPQ